ncbi:Uncharacterized membrane protein [Limimonas halophila]|uniref:Uncharacterized membrane protein n=1 Tax=Limimonas halophila TaxID=1082479 RepID=A0A1G7LH55_9PROT|nr:DUF2244 domain-containing protein [Limimonas halophila]SDF48857.1 Uncharacterized membrane protein [Limimonas halophila]
MGEANVPLFHADLWPHRSLKPSGAAVVFGLYALLATPIVIKAAIHGFWPIPLLMGLTLAGMLAAYLINRRGGRMLERLELTPRALRVERRMPGGAVQRWRFTPGWVRVALAERRAGDNRLTLTESGRRLEVGGFLSPDERREVADALNDALTKARSAAL